MAAVTLLGTATFNTTTGTHTVTATPAVGDLLVIVVANTGNTTSPSPVSDNNAGGSGTYTQLRAASRSGVDSVQIFARDALITSATSTIFTNAAGTTTGGGLVVLKLTGMSRAGLATALRTGNTITGAAGGTPSPSLGSTPLSTNPVIGAVFNSTSPATMTPRTGYTEHVDVGYSTPTTGLEVMSRDSGETSASITWGSTSATIYSAVVVELDSSVPQPTLAQSSFGFYEDGTESGSTAIVSQDTNITRGVSFNSNLGLRVRIQESAGTAGATTDDYQLQYSQNGGTYTNVGSGAVIGYNSASLTDSGATTNRLGAGTGSFVAGKISEDGLVDDHQLTASNYTEHLYSLTLVSSALSDADTLDFRVLRNGAVLDTYAITPRITASKPPAGAPVYVQSVVKSAGASPAISPAFASSVAVGDLVVVSIGANANGTGLITGVTDSLGNTYAAIPGFETPDNTNATGTLCGWYTRVTNAGSANVVTVAFNDTLVSINFIAQHFNGFTGTATFDTKSTSVNTSSTTATSGATAATSTAIELVVGIAFHPNSLASYSLGSGFTNLVDSAVANRQMAMESKAVTSTGTQTATFGMAAARLSIGGVATFYNASGGAANTTDFFLMF